MANVIEFSLTAKDNMAKGFAAARVALKSAAVGMTAFGAAAGVTSKAIIKVGSENENLRIRMNAMLGSVAEGNRLFKDMATFASKVPFAYDEIMSSATQLSGVMRGGVNEINKWMPMIADLAAVSGLSIEQTTGQVVRMYSAGAGAADLFRERGINSMLGFEAGVSVSAEETRKKLIEAFESPTSKFRGASLQMATTWDGVMSMIGDKWRAIQVQIADAGLFNYFKALAITVDKIMGSVLENSADNAQVWSNAIISGIELVMDAVGHMSTLWRGLELVWAGLRVAWAEFVVFALSSIEKLANGIVKIANMIPGIDVEPFDNLTRSLLEATVQAGQAQSAFQDLRIEPLLATQLEKIKEDTRATFADLEAISEESQNAIANTVTQIATKTEEEKEKTKTFLEQFAEDALTFADVFGQTMDQTINGLSQGMANTIVEGGNMVKVFQNLGKQVLTSLIGMLIKMGLQRLFLQALTSKATGAEAAAGGAKAVGLAFANGVASMAGAPFPINLTAPAFGAAMGAAAAAQLTAGMAMGASIGATAGIAHGGLTNVPNEATYLLNRGERVLSPNQNEDFTNFINSGAGNGQVTIENIQITILPNATNADALLSMTAAEMEEIVAGPIIDALNSLDRKGVTPDFIERNS